MVATADVGGYHLLVLGLGFCGKRFATKASMEGWGRVQGTVTSQEAADAVNGEEGRIEALVLKGEPAPDFAEQVAGVTHVLTTAAPAEGEGDPFLASSVRQVLLDNSDTIQWVGYLSTTGVYGHHDGKPVTEDAEKRASLARGKRRVVAEKAWLDTGLPVHIFRLPGIYGPGRGPLAKLRSGRTKRLIVKPGHCFNRIHVDDICQALFASVSKPNPGHAYNVADDKPTESHVVSKYACELMNIELPPKVDYNEAELTGMAATFYKESRVVDNTKLKTELGVSLLYPSYIEGLVAQLEEERSHDITPGH